MSHGRSPALIIRFPPGTTPDTRDQLVALLTEHDLVAIHEDDVVAPRVWTACFATPRDRAGAASAIVSAGIASPADLEHADLEEGDWARRTQSDLPAVRVGRVVVAPPWDIPDHATTEATGSSRAPSAGGPEVVIVIAPSRGFGTGHHQSTRLCLALLQQRALAGRRVIDVGTGSGVLAIAAAKLGAAAVSAIDVDPDAVENARENIARNGVARVVEVRVGDVTAWPLAPADLVVANLTGTLLARHAAPLAALLRPAGGLIAAGFTASERVLVRDAFFPALAVTETAEEDDWMAYVFTRSTDGRAQGAVGG